MTDGFFVDERRGFTYRVVKQERIGPDGDHEWDGEILVGGQDAVETGVRLQFVNLSENDGTIYLDRDVVIGLIKALALTLGEVERGEGIQP